MAWKYPVKNVASLPAVGNTTGDLRAVLDSGDVYRWGGSSWSYQSMKVSINTTPHDTDSLVEGTTNLFFTNARAVAAQNNNIDGGAAATTYGGIDPIDGGSA